MIYAEERSLVTTSSYLVFRVVLRHLFGYYLYLQPLTSSEHRECNNFDDMKLYRHSTFVKKWGFVGDFSGGGTPGSIPNPVVKPTRADGT